MLRTTFERQCRDSPVLVRTTVYSCHSLRRRSLRNCSTVKSDEESAPRKASEAVVVDLRDQWDSKQSRRRNETTAAAARLSRVRLLYQQMIACGESIQVVRPSVRCACVCVSCLAPPPVICMNPNLDPGVPGRVTPAGPWSGLI